MWPVVPKSPCSTGYDHKLWAHGTFMSTMATSMPLQYNGAPSPSIYVRKNWFIMKSFENIIFIANPNSGSRCFCLLKVYDHTWLNKVTLVQLKTQTLIKKKLSNLGKLIDSSISTVKSDLDFSFVFLLMKWLITLNLTNFSWLQSLWQVVPKSPYSTGYDPMLWAQDTFMSIMATSLLLHNNGVPLLYI